jgi:hypothetical protein
MNTLHDTNHRLWVGFGLDYKAQTRPVNTLLMLGSNDWVGVDGHLGDCIAQTGRGLEYPELMRVTQPARKALNSLIVARVIYVKPSDGSTRICPRANDEKGDVYDVARVINRTLGLKPPNDNEWGFSWVSRLYDPVSLKLTLPSPADVAQMMGIYDEGFSVCKRMGRAFIDNERREFHRWVTT